MQVDIHGTVATIVLVVAMVRVYELLRALVWISTKGREYSTRREGMTGESLSDFKEITQLYEATGALFRPFGVRLARLRRSLSKSRRGWRQAFMATWFGFIRLIWPYYAFVLITSTAIVGSISVFGADRMGIWTRGVIYAVSVLMLLGSVSIATELVLCHLIMGSWTAYYNPAMARRFDRTAEIAFFVGAIIIAYPTGVVATFCAATLFDSFERIDLASPWTAFGDSCYFVWTALTGNGDASPIQWHGKLVTTGVYMHHAAFVFMALTVIGGAVFGRQENVASISSNASARPDSAIPFIVPPTGTSSSDSRERSQLWLVLSIGTIIASVAVALSRRSSPNRSRDRL